MLRSVSSLARCRAQPLPPLSSAPSARSILPKERHVAGSSRSQSHLEPLRSSFNFLASFTTTRPTFAPLLAPNLLEQRCFSTSSGARAKHKHDVSFFRDFGLTSETEKKLEVTTNALRVSDPSSSLFCARAELTILPQPKQAIIARENIQMSTNSPAAKKDTFSSTLSDTWRRLNDDPHRNRTESYEAGPIISQLQHIERTLHLPLAEEHAEKVARRVKLDHKLLPARQEAARNFASSAESPPSPNMVRLYADRDCERPYWVDIALWLPGHPTGHTKGEIKELEAALRRVRRHNAKLKRGGAKQEARGKARLDKESRSLGKRRVGGSGGRAGGSGNSANSGRGPVGFGGGGRNSGSGSAPVAASRGRAPVWNGKRKSFEWIKMEQIVDLAAG